MYFGALFGYDAAERRRRTARLLDQVGIAGERRLQLRKFSKGMLQRVGIAQALLNDPDLVILDEPMSGLDPLGRRDVRALILGLRDRGCTVFFSSHVLSDAEALCSRVAILARGRLVASGGLNEMLAFEATRMGTGRRRHPRRASAVGRRRHSSSRADWRWPVHARAAARSAAGASAGRSRRLGREADLAQPDPSDARGPVRRAGHVARPRWRRGEAPRTAAHESHRRDCRQRVPRIGPRQGAVQPRAVRDPDDGRVVSARSAHRRTGCEDHQGPRAGGDIGVRRVHRRVHRHRSGLEGSRAQERLQPAPQADSSLSTDSRQVRRPRAHAGREHPHHDARLLRGAAVHGVGNRSGGAARVGCAGARSGAAQGDWSHPDRAAARDRHRALLLDLLDAHPVGGPDVRALHRRPLQHRPQKLRSGRRLARGGAARAGAVLGAAEPWPVRREVAGRSRAAGPGSATWR